MKKLFVFIVLTMLTLNMSAQVYRFVSTAQVIVDVDFSTTTWHDKVYLTFDYDKKIITLSSAKGQRYIFKMISAYEKESILLGKTMNILVSSTDAPNVKRFYFNADGSFKVIWMENKDGKVTTFGNLIVL